MSPTRPAGRCSGRCEKAAGRASQHHAHARQVASTSSPAATASRYSGDGPCLGRLRARPRHRQGRACSPARATILATGGAGRVYSISTNPRGATGDGIAMAWRAGCRVANMEFIQFHPTCLYHPEVKNFLITEAVRGEGGQLKIPDTGTPLHAALRPARRAGAARHRRPRDRPRDQAARPRLRPSRHQPPRAGLRPRAFPDHRTRGCSSPLGIDITREPIPVVPAAHYTCGGVITDLDGRTDLPGLYAAGEVTMSGLHGANRLASNSLLECFVFGVAAAKHINAAWDELRAAAADPRLGRKPRHRFRRGSGRPPQLDRDPPLHVGLCRHRAHHQAARARAAPDQAAAPRRSQRLLRPLPGHRRPDRAAQPRSSRRPHRPLRPRAARRAAGCTTRSIIRRCCPRRWTRC